MKIKAACIGCPNEVTFALSGTKFASRALQEVIGDCLGVENVLDRPAEYYIQAADIGPASKPGVMGVEVRLTGASRDGRTPKQFHKAKQLLQSIVEECVTEVLNRGEKCQVFCVLMLDAPVETDPGSGQYSTELSTKATWIDGQFEPS